MSTELAALVGESYERAYTDMIRVQQLAELDEVIDYKQALAMQHGVAAGNWRFGKCALACMACVTEVQQLLEL